MAIRLLTDSTSDILPDEAARRGISVVPLNIMFGEKSYREGIDLDHQSFYQLLAQAKELPTTSQPTPDDFLPYFQKAKEQGDSLVCIFLSAKLSGTVQSAQIAKELCGYDDIHIIDSTQTMIAQRALVDFAQLLLEQGCGIQTLVSQVRDAAGRVRLFGVVNTLEYLHKGGRLSSSVALVGGLLKVKPTLTIQDGAVGMLGKGVGIKGSLAALMNYLGDDLRADPRLPIYYGYTAQDQLCRQLIEQSEEHFGTHPYEIHSIGSVVGTHVGPGCGAIAYLERA